MRVSMPTIFNNVQQNLQRLVEDLQYTNAQISTGRKYQQISDNPLDVGSLLGLNSESSQVSQYQRNLETANNWLSSTETALSNINELVSSSAALAEQMATGTYSAEQRAAAAEQVQQYMEEMMQMGNTRFAGKYILGGYDIDTEPFVMQDFTAEVMDQQLQGTGTPVVSVSAGYSGPSGTYIVEIEEPGGAPGTATFRVSKDGGQTWTTGQQTQITPTQTAIDTDVFVDFGDASVTWAAGDRFTVAVHQPVKYQGDENNLELNIGRNSTLAVSQVGGDVIGGKTPPEDPDLFQIMAHLKSNLEANDAAGVGARMEELREYQANLNATVAGLGAGLNRVEIKQNTYETLQGELTQTIATKGDTDVVEATTALASKQLAYQAALQASTLVMQMSLLDYL